MADGAVGAAAIEVRVDDLAFVDADAVAWPVTAELHPTTPLLRRVEEAGGAALASQLRTQEPLAVGSAVVTGAGGLGVELLVSAVVSSDSEPVTAAGARRALTSALQRAVDWQISHLAIAPFGLGAGQLALDECAALMLEEIARHARGASFPARVTVVVESALEEEIFRAALARVLP
ncbi:MAG TPA: macro domain-containing protein [Gemmatimonadaceae bacterium]